MERLDLNYDRDLYASKDELAALFKKSKQVILACLRDQNLSPVALSCSGKKGPPVKLYSKPEAVVAIQAAIITEQIAKVTQQTLQIQLRTL